MDHDQIAVNTIKTLAMDAVERANSGHPGMPMGMADIAVVLWTRHLLVDPGDPTWFDRDRFVVSNGHGSMLLYALLHLSGFDITMGDIKNFRQFGSPTPGHPEIDQGRGIETTTGPLGQGFGTAVGMAIAEKHLRAVFGPDLVDHRTYAFVSDGDVMEGISSEAASLAGRLGLGKIVYLYDDNEISIGGDTDITLSEDVNARFAAFRWHVLDIDGHDRDAIDEAVTAAKAVEDRPSLIVCHTHIAHGAPTKQDTAEAHGSPLGPEEIAATKRDMGWPPNSEFEVPDEVYTLFREAMVKGADARQAWERRRDAAFEEEPDVLERWKSYMSPPEVEVGDLGFETGESVATRKASGKAINAIAPVLPGLLGGSADLAPSTNTLIDSSPEFQDDPIGRNFRFGVREHAMGAAVNGMAIHGGLRPYGATFLTFNDYMRPATRLAALMDAPSIFVYTHDSIFLGEDGPTHQPIEHLASLRAMPNMWVIRPADAGETGEAWEMALRRTEGPSCLILTRQGLPVLDRAGLEGSLHRGGYVIREGDDAVLVATGSEVWVALEAAEALVDDGISLRVVSLPCWEAFFDQDRAYQAEVLGEGLPRASLEAGATFGWERIVGARGLTIGVDHFGESAPWEKIAEEWGFTPDAVAKQVKGWLKGLG
ncbi:MAG TPA: transketolase [Acidimicrobiia bacterium]|nr:transketolase [Acidimicrobiia bacterium]